MLSISSDFLQVFGIFVFKHDFDQDFWPRESVISIQHLWFRQSISASLSSLDVPLLIRAHGPPSKEASLGPPYFLGKEYFSLTAILDLYVFTLFLIYRSGLQTGRFALAYRPSEKEGFPFLDSFPSPSSQG
ncbi:MAG TPA: hypothetical protein DCS30_19440 [Rhizobiales bacterium]|nr:hypothetical protein [Hyphomicrobiales bacterium]